MNGVPAQSPSKVKLPHVLVIGFTGHRQLPDAAKSRDVTREVLTEWKAKIPGVVCALSSVALGGDLLFAESCLELKIPLRVFLPMPKEQFRDDFDPETWEHVESVLRSALSVEVIGTGTEKPERYYETGIETARQSQLLIALWDGLPSRGFGGTSDVVDFALKQSRPVVWIHSVTGEVRRFNVTSGMLNDKELEFLNGLPDPAARTTGQTPNDLVQSWLTKMDENASRTAPQFRRLAAIPILCTAAAAVLGSRSSSPGGAVIWLWLGTALGIAASVLPFLMRLTRRQVSWTRERTAAEVCRSCLALWRTPGPYDAIGPEALPELAGILRCLNFLKLSDQGSHRATLEEFKRDYRKERVQHQISYLDRHARRAARQIRRLRIVIGVSVAVALALNIFMLLNAHGWNHWISPRWRPELAVAAAAGFQIATVAAALIFVYDYERRRERYRELHRMLAEWEKQLEMSRTWPVVLRIASMVEKALLAELIEWRSLIRHRRMPDR